MWKAHTYNEVTDTDKFFFSGRAWWLNWAMLVFFLAMGADALYSHQTDGRITALPMATLCAGLSILFALAAARRSHPVLVITGRTLEHVNLIRLWLRPTKMSIDGVTAVSEINGTLSLRYESGTFEYLQLNLIEAKARSAVVDSIQRRISNVGEPSTA